MNKVIWFDFENTPHVWVLKEFITKLKDEGFQVIITARNFSSTISLCKYLKIPFVEISLQKNYKTKLAKIFAAILRAYILKKYIQNNDIRPILAISHGSRSQGLAAYFLGIPVISLDDYEYSSKLFNIFVKYLLTPKVIPKQEWGIFSKRVIHYPGLKEELYLWNEKNYSSEKYDFIKENSINIVFRPEGRYTHYSSKKSRMLQRELISYLIKNKNIFVILIARDKFQEKEIIDIFNQHQVKYHVPQKILNGPALLYSTDLVIGGGGTMTREAAILGIPAYTFFGGKLGHVDKFLIEKNRLTLISKISDIHKIALIKKKNTMIDISNSSFEFVYKFIKKLLL